MDSPQVDNRHSPRRDVHRARCSVRSGGIDALGILLAAVVGFHSGTVPAAPRDEPLPEPLRIAPAARQAPVLLEDVRDSVDRFYPLLAATQQERGIAAGENLSAQGAFDLQLDASNETGALGFYKTNRARVGAEQPLWYGGKAYAGYRVGRGAKFEPWYLERETNKGGEFQAGFAQPLLQNLAIDKRRAGLVKSNLGRQSAEPEIDRQRIIFLYDGSEKYWKWVSAGHSYRVARSLMAIAELRMQAVERRVSAGDLAEIEQTDNQRLIASRRAKLVQAERKFLQSAVELSLYWRDDQGQPQLPPAERLPAFPEPAEPDASQLDREIVRALQYRPELRYVRLQRQKTSVDLQLARNRTLPSLDAGMFAAQDVGQQVLDGTKTPFQLEAGLYFDVPVQRRNALGQIRTYESQLAQLAARERYYGDRIAADVRIAMAGLVTSFNELGQARQGARLAVALEQAERQKFDVGDSNLLLVNLREQATADARLLEIDALESFHIAVAEYRAALALDVATSSDP